MTGAWWQYALIFVGAVFLSLVCTPLAIATALRRGVLDKPGGHKSHSSPVPYLGGLAVVVSFSVSMLIPVLAINESSVSNEFVVVIGVALALALLGLFDDLRGLSSTLRLACEIAAGVVLWNLDIGVQLVGVSWVDAIITVFWVVGITNAFNLLDNMDGLSAGIAAIASFSFFAIAASNGQYMVAGLSLALGGCALGFLRHNFHPARVYMGDSGALFFGFLIAFVGLKLQLNISRDVSVLIPIVVCSVAVLDTTLVTVARLRHGLSPFQGGNFIRSAGLEYGKDFGGAVQKKTGGGVDGSARYSVGNVGVFAVERINQRTNGQGRVAVGEDVDVRRFEGSI